MKYLILVMCVISIILILGCTSQIQEQRKQCIECCENNPETGEGYDCIEMCNDHIRSDIDEQGRQSFLNMECEWKSK